LPIGYANTAGIATYATNSGISTNVIGGIGSITSLTVSGISTLGGVQISSGIVTASSGIATYYGDGSKLSGVTGTQVISQPFTGTPVYPVLASNSGVSSVGIATTGSTALVFIPSSGNLGIGTTNPLGSLQVGTAITMYGSTGIISAYQYYGDGSKLSNIITVVSISTNTTNQSQYLTYATGTGSTAGLGVTTSSLVFNPSTTRLGIGTTTPTSTLHVQGNALVTGVSTLGLVQIYSSGTTGIVTAASIGSTVFYYGDGSGLTKINATTSPGGSTGQVQFNNGTAIGGASYFNYDSTNVRVGIGTSVPTARLSVANPTTGNSLLLVNDNLSDGSLFRVSNSAGSLLVDVDSGGTILFPTSGNVGIGTTLSTPTTKLHVDGDIRITRALYDSNNATGSSGQVLQSVGTGISWVTLSISAVTYATNAGTSTSVIGGISSVTQLNVSGISTLGVTSTTNLTSQQLQISGISTFSNGTVLIGGGTSTGTSGQVLQVAGINSSVYIGGNLAIGTTNPQGTLQVGTAITMYGSTGIVSAKQYYGDGSTLTNISSGVSISTNTTNQAQYLTYAIGTGSTTGFGVTTSGLVFNPSTTRLGIGTTNPSYNLHVNGSFGATTKSFIINHPTKKGKKLQYGSLEGPELGVYVRGRTQESIIELPEYWTELVDEETITVNLTAMGRNSGIHNVLEISNNTVIIESTNNAIDCFYTIFGERKDVAKLEVEISEEN
jgi:plastocyanin